MARVFLFPLYDQQCNNRWLGLEIVRTQRMLITNAVKLNCANELSSASSTALLVTVLGLKPK